MVNVGEIVKQTEKKGKSTKFQPGHSGGPGRPKGSLNRNTKLRNAIIDAIEKAAGQYQKGMSVDDYLGSICKEDPMQFLRIAASILPKDLNIGGQADNPVRVIRTSRREGQGTGHSMPQPEIIGFGAASQG